MPPASKVVIRLTDDQRDALEHLLRAGSCPAAMRRRAEVLLLTDAGGPDALPDEDVAEQLGTSRMTVQRVRHQFAAEGLDATLHRKKPTGPPVPQIGWPAGGPTDRPGLLVGPRRADAVDHEVAGRQAGRATGGREHRPGDGVADAPKNDLKPWLKQQWVIPPGNSGAFVAAMEDVIEVYHRPHDPNRPVVCVDEAGKQLIGEVRPPLPVRVGSPAKEDGEYVRNGTANLFLAFEPLAGRRVVEATDRRTAVDFARFLKRLLDEAYPTAARVVRVTDNLNTHCMGSLYEAFTPAEARRLAARIEWHYTPKHGSWLNMAEIELSVLARQCLDRRIPDAETLKREVGSWERRRNTAAVKADWQFATADARVKLKKLYPTVQLQ